MSGSGNAQQNSRGRVCRPKRESVRRWKRAFTTYGLSPEWMAWAKGKGAELGPVSRPTPPVPGNDAGWTGTLADTTT